MVFSIGIFPARISVRVVGAAILLLCCRAQCFVRDGNSLVGQADVPAVEFESFRAHERDNPADKIRRVVNRRSNRRARIERQIFVLRDGNRLNVILRQVGRRNTLGRVCVKRECARTNRSDVGKQVTAEILLVTA